MGNAEPSRISIVSGSGSIYGRKRCRYGGSTGGLERMDGESRVWQNELRDFGLAQSGDFGDDDEHKNQAKFALQSESLPRLQAMLKLAQSERLLADDGSGWDDRPLDTRRGKWSRLILETGKLRAGDENDKITLQTSIVFNPHATCPRWDLFLFEIFDGNQESVSYVHRAVGYSLTGDTSEQCFFCRHGEGGNGKTMFLNAVRFVVGGDSCNLPFSAFELQARSTIPNDVAILPGRQVCNGN